MTETATFFRGIREFLEVPLVHTGTTVITLWSVVTVILLLAILAFLTIRIRRWTSRTLLATTNLDATAREAAGRILQYAVFTVGLLIVVQTAGIDLTTLNVLAGAVGLGVGFGLQNVASNFVAGLIIMFERPIKLGDRIDVGGIEGDVVHIGPRSTSVVTNDNITIIIPNSRLIAENVINWSHNDERVRFPIPVSVAYGSDPALVERVLLEVAAANPDVLQEPAPVVRFMAFQDSSLGFELRAWTDTLTHRKGRLISSLNFAIHDALVRHQIQIPFPQRDIHIRTVAPAAPASEDQGSDRPATPRRRPAGAKRP